MLIKFLQHTEIDYDKWDHCIANSFNGSVYAFSWYLDAVSDQWHALIEGDYERVLPLVVGRRWGIDYIYPPFFVQHLGVFSQKILNLEVLHHFLDHIPSKYKYIHMNLNPFNKVERSRGVLTEKVKFELDLIKSYARIRENYSPELLNNLRYAYDKKLTVNRNIKPDDVIALYQHNHHEVKKRIKETDYLRFKRLIYAGIYKGMTDVYGVYNQVNDLCAAAVLMRSHKRAILLLSAKNQFGKESNALSFLIDVYLRDYAGRHLTFDFGTLVKDCDDAFFHGFGGQEIYYDKIVINRLNKFQKLCFHFI